MKPIATLLKPYQEQKKFADKQTDVQTAVQVREDGTLVLPKLADIRNEVFAGCMYQLAVAVQAPLDSDTMYHAKERLLYEILAEENIGEDEFVRRFKEIRKTIRYATWTIAEFMDFFEKPKMLTYDYVIQHNPKYYGLDGYVVNGKLFFHAHTEQPIYNLNRTINNGVMI